MYQMYAPLRGRLLTMSNSGELADEPIEGPHPEGARLIRAALGKMSSRGAMQKMTSLGYTLNHSTINNMRNGQSAESDSVIKFARAFRLDANQLLEAFGHHAAERSGKPSKATVIEHLLDPDEQLMLRYYRGLPPELRSPALDAIKGYVTAGDLLLQRERERSIGRRIEDETDTDQEIRSDQR